MPSESLPVVVMVVVALSFIFFEAHAAGSAWPVEAVAEVGFGCSGGL